MANISNFIIMNVSDQFQVLSSACETGRKQLINMAVTKGRKTAKMWKTTKDSEKISIVKEAKTVGNKEAAKASR